MYFGSFFFRGTNFHLAWTIPLILGAMVLVLPLRLLEPEARSPSYFFVKFTKDMPRWTFPFLISIWLITLAHVAWFFWQSNLGSPMIEDGQYVILRGSHIIKVLTLSQYLSIMDERGRTVAAVMVSTYITLSMYWLLSRPADIAH